LLGALFIGVWHSFCPSSLNLGALSLFGLFPLCLGALLVLPS